MKNKTRRKWNVITACALGLTGIASAATSEKYTYDASGNIIEKSIDGVVTRMSYDESNRLLSMISEKGKEIYSYDPVGRAEAVKGEGGKMIRALVHGYSDKVMETRGENGKADFYYNAAGQLVGKKVSGSSVAYTWNQDALVAMGGETYVNESHVSGGVPIIKKGNEVVVSDHLGNTLVSGSKQFTGTAYGSGLEAGRFTGKTYVEELGSYVFPNRLYSSQSGRWNVADPSGFPDRENNLSYVNGDPLTTIDPTGLVEYTWDPTADHQAFNVFQPKAITEKTAGTVKVVEVDKGNGNKCYKPVVDKKYEFKGGGAIFLAEVGWVSDGHLCDATFHASGSIHETWHKTHRKTLGDKTYGALETWSAAYTGNEFGSHQKALDAGNADFAAAKAQTATEYASNTGRSGSHEGSPAPGTYREKRTEGGVDVWRSVNPDWGQTLDTSLNTINLTYTLTAKDCEY